MRFLIFSFFIIWIDPSADIQFLHSIARIGIYINRLVESTYSLGVITYLDDALFTCLDRLAGPFRYGAPAGGFHMGEYEWCFSGIPECELTLPVSFEWDLPLFIDGICKCNDGISPGPFTFLIPA